MTREDKLKIIEQAQEDALRNTHMRFAVYEDRETGDFYQFSDIAGGNSQPIGVLNGTDKFVCGFNHQYWSPEDMDDDFRTNLMTYLNEKQKEQVKAKEEEEEEELTGQDIAEMFPEAYDEYCEDMIDYMMSEEDPEQYLDDYEALEEQAKAAQQYWED